SELAAVHHVDGSQSVARSQNAVVSGWGTAALNVAEHYRPRFKASALFDLARQRQADSAQPGMPEVVAIILSSPTVLLVPIGKLCAFGRDNDAEISSARVALPDQFGNLINIEWNFRDQDYIGAAGDPAIGRDPARGSAHHFYHDHTIVRLCRRMDTIDGFGCDIDRRVEAKGEVGAGQIIVDRLRDTHHPYFFF